MYMFLSFLFSSVLYRFCGDAAGGIRRAVAVGKGRRVKREGYCVVGVG